MKIKNKLITFLLLFLIFSNTVKTKNYQQVSLENELKGFSTNPFIPLEFSPEGINNFFDNIYNQNWYAQEFLPNNFSHMIQFLRYGKESGQTGSFLKSVIKLFSNKLKATSYVNCYAFIELLDELPDLISHYFVIPEIDIFETNKKVINNILYEGFLSQFASFKQNPKQFLHDVSGKIAQTLHKKSNIIDVHVNMEHLRQSLVRFLEIASGKLIWNPKDHENIWHLFHSTSKNIEKLAEHTIIADLDNVDDLSWSLIHRFCFFLDIAGQSMPIDFYAKFKEKLFSANLFMFEIEEQEESIKTKELHLVHALFEGEAKARAYQSGMVLS